ncbi:MAG: GGDEF domain-containing protein, partial [Firmicutes bacterium]|nr:GGDEF domain-containing protein [Bacillota bacterium]
MTEKLLKPEILGFIIFWIFLALIGIFVHFAAEQAVVLPFHAIAEVLTVSLALGIFLVLWYSKSWNERLEYYLIAVSFLGVTILGLFHAALSYPEVAACLSPGASRKASLFLWGESCLAVGGLFVGSLVSVSERGGKGLRYTLLFLVLGATATIAGIILRYPFVPGDGPAPAGTNLETAALVLAGGAAVFYLLKYIRLRHPAYLVITQVSGAIPVGGVVFSLGWHAGETFLIINHLYKLVAFCLLFHAVFVVAVKEPFERLSQVQENLRWVNENLENLVALRTADLRVVNEQLRKAATTDFLTGALNRRQFLQKIQEIWLQAKISRQPFAVLMLDIDGFKKINDTLGHQVGDQCLQQVVALARMNLRQNDVIGRYGGDEFAVVLPQSDIHEAAKVARRLLSAVENYANPRFTISVGIAAFSQDGEDVERI